MLYSIGGIPNRRSSSGRLASKVELIVAAMGNFSLNKICVLMTAMGGICGGKGRGATSHGYGGRTEP
jgi:hypothetical protein